MRLVVPPIFQVPLSARMRKGVDSGDPKNLVKERVPTQFGSPVWGLMSNIIVAEPTNRRGPERNRIRDG